MTKRRLSNQQKARVLRKKEENINTTNSEENFGAKQDGLVIKNYGNTILVESNTGELHHCNYRQNIGTIITGDKVIWQQQLSNKTGIITSVYPRVSILARPSKFSHDKKDIAANITQIIIVLAVEPEPIEHYIDRYLIACENQKITPIIILNKADLLNKKNNDFFTTLINRYQKIGYAIYTMCAYNINKNSITFEQIFKNQSSIFVGQSGVGKSQIIRSLLNTNNIKTGEISNRNKKGKHTTTSTTLYHLSNNSIIIDSPGIREFGVWDLPIDAIYNGFREFKSISSSCKYRNCDHTVNSPGCALQSAVINGEIDELRLLNYHRILKDLE